MECEKSEEQELFYKRTGGEHELVFKKYLWLHEVAMETGAFIAPKPHSLQGDTIALEKIEKIVSFSRLLRAQGPKPWDRIVRSAEEIGSVLALIHGTELRFVNDDDSTDNLSEELNLALSEGRFDLVPGHGDFGATNVQIADWGNLAEVVVLDPMPNFYTTHAVHNMIPRLLDLAQMVQSMEPRFVKNSLDLSHIRTAQIGFLSQYSQGHKIGASFEQVFRLGAVIRGMYLKQMSQKLTARGLAASVVMRWALLDRASNRLRGFRVNPEQDEV